MDEITQIFQDPYFWTGVGLFVFSIMGIVWILKSLQKHPEENSVLTAENTVVALPTQAKETKSEKIPVTLELLSNRLDNIEKLLATLTPKIGQSQDKNELSEEVRAIQQTLKKAGPGDTKDIRDLSTKLDKIYQVLVSLSAPDGK